MASGNKTKYVHGDRLKSKLSTTSGTKWNCKTLFSNLFPEHSHPCQSLVNKPIVLPPNSHHWASVAMSGWSGFSNKHNVLIFTLKKCHGSPIKVLHFILQHYHLYKIIICYNLVLYYLKRISKSV